jgi:hypothetical protein
MKRNDFEQLILSELKELKDDVKENRKDTAVIREHIAGQDAKVDAKLEAFKGEQKFGTRMQVIIGTALAVVISKLTGHS